MPGDPKECRLHAMYCMELFLHAMNCMELVEDTANPEMRRIFFDWRTVGTGSPTSWRILRCGSTP